MEVHDPRASSLTARPPHPSAQHPAPTLLTRCWPEDGCSLLELGTRPRTPASTDPFQTASETLPKETASQSITKQQLPGFSFILAPTHPMLGINKHGNSPPRPSPRGRQQLSPSGSFIQQHFTLLFYVSFLTYF